MDSSSFSNSAAAVGSSKKKKKGGGGGMKLSTDPQSVAARQRRHRISERFKILQSLIPGGSKMDTVSMLEEAIQYVKFLKTQIWLHQAMIDLVGDPAFQPADCAAHCHDVEMCGGGCLGGHVEAEMDDVALSECWVLGGESGVFDF